MTQRSELIEERSSRRGVLIGSAVGIFSTVLPPAVAAASTPVPADPGDTIGFRRANTDDPSSRIEVFWYPASGSFNFNVTITITSAAVGSLNATDGQSFTLGPFSSSTGIQTNMPDSISLAAGSVLSGAFVSTSSPPRTFERTGHVWGTDTL